MCGAPRSPHGGKLFRVDVDLGNAAGNCQRKTVYVWLCSRCAQELNPTIEVAKGTVRVRLAAIRRPLIANLAMLPSPSLYIQ